MQELGSKEYGNGERVPNSSIECMNELQDKLIRDASRHLPENTIYEIRVSNDMQRMGWYSCGIDRYKMPDDLFRLLDGDVRELPNAGCFISARQITPYSY